MPPAPGSHYTPGYYTPGSAHCVSSTPQNSLAPHLTHAGAASVPPRFQPRAHTNGQVGDVHDWWWAAYAPSPTRLVHARHPRSASEAHDVENHSPTAHGFAAGVGAQGTHAFGRNALGGSSVRPAAHRQPHGLAGLVGEENDASEGSTSSPHAVHAPVPAAGLWKPALQSVHGPPAAAPSYPTAQMHSPAAVAAGADVKPAPGHAVHACWPSADLYLPAAGGGGDGADQPAEHSGHGRAALHLALYESSGLTRGAGFAWLVAANAGVPLRTEAMLDGLRPPRCAGVLRTCCASFRAVDNLVSSERARNARPAVVARRTGETEAARQLSCVGRR